MTDADNATGDDLAQAAATEVAQAAAAPAAGEPGAGPARVNRRKVREGIAASAAMDKTVVVEVTDRVRHRRYDKIMQRTSRLYAHDEGNEVRAGDRVRVQETRPLSKLKRWRVVDILERAR